MTREEAIKILRTNVMVACDTSDKVGYDTPLNKAIEQALEMAIKALEQEPYDCVSRKSLLDKLDPLYKEKIKTAPDNMAEGFLQVSNIIKNESPVTPTRRWIPTSERQPEENGNYLAFYRTSDGTASLEFMMVDHCNAGGGWLHEEKGRKAYKKVVAWMPLPAEPYNAEMEGKE